ncbi:hypothetical protein [Pseudalkalibacillus salsuginis]|uniref:hypothetical protein n=1 Tax=Pseudalkalibacillus salsuginis TaxID=2910972 RepID=UPI001F44C311|nr:hypothetical protein [Pseudalkalibacillus salsuginis]MCF6409465.1 hypothetical protein [Pseudalkalibacillus salsuginis]
MSKRYSSGCSEEIVYCEPETIVRDTYVTREVTYVHPINIINRHHIVEVPKHVYKKSTKDVYVESRKSRGSYDSCSSDDDWLGYW